MYKNINHSRVLSTLSLWSQIPPYDSMDQDTSIRIFQRQPPPPPPFRATSEIKLRIHHPRGQRKYNLILQNIAREYDLLTRLRSLKYSQTYTPSKASINEYEHIGQLLFRARWESKSKFRRIHMSGLQSYRTIKIEQLHICLVNSIIKHKYKNRNIKLKTIWKLTNITRRIWWLKLELMSNPSKIKIKKKKKKLKEKSAKTRVTYIEERSKEISK